MLSRKDSAFSISDSTHLSSRANSAVNALTQGSKSTQGSHSDGLLAPPIEHLSQSDPNTAPEHASQPSPVPVDLAQPADLLSNSTAQPNNSSSNHSNSSTPRTLTHGISFNNNNSTSSNPSTGTPPRTPTVLDRATSQPAPLPAPSNASPTATPTTSSAQVATTSTAASSKTSPAQTGEDNMITMNFCIIKITGRAKWGMFAQFYLFNFLAFLFVCDIDLTNFCPVSFLLTSRRDLG
jgi:hypothetical protein